MKKCMSVEYDIVLSFAAEDRKYVEKVANFLIKSDISVFYDLYEDVNLWGKDLYQHLDNIYQFKAKYAVIFISDAYKNKLWTNHELKSAQARAFCENEEYILPARLDNTEITGIRKTIGYINLNELTPIQFAKKIIKKLDLIERECFLPEDITFVKEIIKENFEIDDDTIDTYVSHVFSLLKKTTNKEREFLSVLAMYSCRHDMSEDWHQDFSYFQRLCGLSKLEIIEILNGLANLGFEYKIQKTKEGCKKDGNQREYDMLSVKLIPRLVNLEFDNVMLFLSVMYLGAMSGKCESCSLKVLNRLDFSDLKDKPDEEVTEVISNYFPDKNDKLFI